jgi:hypothetical protein
MGAWHAQPSQAVLLFRKSAQYRMPLPSHHPLEPLIPRQHEAVPRRTVYRRSDQLIRPPVPGHRASSLTTASGSIISKGRSATELSGSCRRPIAPSCHATGNWAEQKSIAANRRPASVIRPMTDPYCPSIIVRNSYVTFPRIRSFQQRNM